jgi:hypothetical protein
LFEETALRREDSKMMCVVAGGFFKRFEQSVSSSFVHSFGFVNNEKARPVFIVSAFKRPNDRFCL